MGRPKALVVGDDEEPWLTRGVRTLQAGGCAEVVVVLGAGAARARVLLDSTPAIVVEAEDWAEGISASLRAGLAAAAERGASVAVVTLVDLPRLDTRSVSRALEGASVTTLRQAAYEGQPGHPVVIGSEHFSALSAHLAGDVGARPYLLAHGVDMVDCSDLGGGDDVDVDEPRGAR
jgi:CTP:molybdopterin cytidylyltransferase MocA